MQISDITVDIVNVGVTPIEDGGLAPYVSNHGAVHDVDRAIVRVETDTGLTGWGETRVFLSPKTTRSILCDGIAPLVLGRSPFEVEALWRSTFVEYTNVAMFFAPFEMACWDLIGKHVDRPVYELLGGWTAPSVTERPGDGRHDPDPYIECAYCVGILPPAASREQAVRAHELGHSVLKTKAGRDWKQDVERIIAMHDAVDGALEFRVDPNQGWRFDEAVRVGAALSDAGIYLQYLEQPIRVNAHDTLAALRDRLTQPIAPNEDTYIAQNVRRLAARGAVDALVVDITPVGGITGLRHTLAIAEDAGIGVAHHCAWDLGIKTAAILHAVYGLPGFSLPPDSVYYAWEDDILADPFEFVDGAIRVPDGPGLGIDVDHDKLERYRVL